jgi:glycosyltransferase involved in cell wall biosynthesis
MEEIVPHVDLIHNQSLWMLPNHYASRAAFRYQKPTLYTTMGFLEPWAIGHSRWKKRFVGAWFQDNDLRRAACIHVNTRQEIDGIRAYGLRNPIAVLPNGVNLAAYAQMPNRAVFDRTYPSLADKRICFFLGRLHQKKGLAHLVRAWARVSRLFPEWHLLIAGPDDGYEATLRRLIADLKVEPSVTLSGPLYGERKLAALAAASLFVLPSFSEGFSMAVLEAMAARLPVLITPGCNFPEVEKASAGLQVRPNEEDTARGLQELLQASDAEREQMGRNGRALVETKYTWDRVARRMIELYQWLIGGGTPPPCVERS